MAVCNVNSRCNMNKKDNGVISGGNCDVCEALVAFNGSLSASRKTSKKYKIYNRRDFMAQESYSYWKPEKYGFETEKYTQDNVIEKVLVNKVEPFKMELGTFVEYVNKNKEVPITSEQDLNNIRISENIARCVK